MSLIRLIICCLFFLMPFLKAEAQDETALQLMQRVQASLVEVRSVDSKTFNEANGHAKVASYHSQGSGVIIDSHGIIVTNTHIVANAPKIFVGLSDGTILEAKLVYSSDADFSFIKIDPASVLRAISWADSSQAKVGTPIIALSNADDEHQHIMGGEITSLINGMSSNSVEAFELNLTLYHGDSGGPLLDSQGHLLGLVMGKKLDASDKSYAIASNKIQQEYLRYSQSLP
ncbi:MAG: serine protease [Candidatus Omnitrophica bacterium]|nr:serine protease [Candidatus Omnitrophota bacterium]